MYYIPTSSAAGDLRRPLFDVEKKEESGTAKVKKCSFGRSTSVSGV